MASILPSFVPPRHPGTAEFRPSRPGTGRRAAAGVALGAAVLLGWTAAGLSPAYAAEAPVGLGTVAAFSVLGGLTVTNTGPTTLAGDLGVYPGSAITGFPASVLNAAHAGDAVAQQAQSDLTIAYNDAAGRAMTASVAGDLVGKTLTAGVYKSSGPLLVSGALTLDGQGDPNSVFIFQVASDLTTASASSIILTNSAQACNVYWQVGSSATLGTASRFNGNILALTSITATTGTTVQGRALARNGQVSLDTNTFTAPGCSTATASPSASATASSTAAPVPLPSTRTAPATAAPATAGPASRGTGAGSSAGAGSGTATGRGVNIDTAAETTAPGAPLALGASAVTLGLAGVWMMTGRRRTSRRTK